MIQVNRIYLIFNRLVTKKFLVDTSDQRLKQIESMKTKVLLAAVAVAFSFAVTSCGNKKAADSNATEADSCCAAKTEQVCDSAKACCQAADSAACPKAACDGAKCDKPCEKK